MSPSVRVRVPATTANLGPGFDSLGLALDLWNEAEFQVSGAGYCISAAGEGEGCLPDGEHNLVVRAARYYFDSKGLAGPVGLNISCNNGIPLGSGMGSSAAAILLGLLGAAALSRGSANSGEPIDIQDILRLAWKMEGHADNAAAALYGGVVVVVTKNNDCLVRRFDVPPIQVTLVKPDVNLPTSASRKALPANVTLRDAVFNLSRTPLVVEALRTGDLDLLGEVIDDRLHQPYRLKLIPGADAALQAAKSAGACAAAISGAGPSLIAFSHDRSQEVGAVMQAAFERSNVTSRVFHLQTSSNGAVVDLFE